jgi:hypothetical protein
MKMNTPTAIFLGLALIAVAIFFRQPSISEAQASNHPLNPRTAENKFGEACLTLNEYTKGRRYLMDWLHARIRQYS